MDPVKIKRGWRWGNDSIEVEETIAGTDLAVTPCEPTLAAGCTDTEVTVSLVIAQAVAYFLTCDQDVTIKLNDPDVPDATIELAANHAILWSDGDEPGPIAVDVSKLYVSHTGATAPTLRIRVAYDPTPTVEPSS